MSRIIVKNLPEKVKDEDFKNHFGNIGVVTDVKLQFKGNKFRRFGFIGFQENTSAAEAVKKYNDTFLSESKISVQICKGLDDSKKITTSALQNENSNNKSIQRKKTKNDKTPTHIVRKQTLSRLGLDKSVSHSLNDPKFKEYLRVNKCEDLLSEIVSRVKDDDDEGGIEADELERKSLANKNVSDLDYLKSLRMKDGDSKNIVIPQLNKKKNKLNLFRIVLRARKMCFTKVPSKGKKKGFFDRQMITDFFKPLDIKALNITRHGLLTAYVGFANEQDQIQALAKNSSFLQGVRVVVKKLDDTPGSNHCKEVEKKPAWKKAEKKLEDTARPLAETGKIFLRNLEYTITEDEIREHFESFGPISDVRLPLCKTTRRPIGIGFVTYVFPENAVRAMNNLDGTLLKGRLLHLLPSLEEEKDEEAKVGNFAEKKAKELKATSSSWHNWNTLFLGSNAVLNAMQEKYGRSKKEILNMEGDQSAAVNLALGESQIVDETKRFLEDNGVSLVAFTDPSVKRSRNVVLVKNLPGRTTAKELEGLFSKFGELGRVLLPPSGISGIIEFLDPGEARKGYRSLAYSKFKNMPLYLEWAPIEIFQNNLDSEDRETKLKISKSEPDKVESNEEKSIEVPTQPESTLYVNKLAKSTTEEGLKAHFEAIGPVISVLIAKRKGISKGYGFVQYGNKADAKKAVVELNDSYLDESSVQLKLSEKMLKTSVLVSERKIHEFGSQAMAKILIKNIPFQATSKEVRQLFRTFGEIKTVRLPNKWQGDTHRGFGFVEFSTKQEAKQAFEALSSSTHLYGRRLVLEWAKDDESVDDLRKRMATKFLEGMPEKKLKRDLEIQGSAPRDFAASTRWN